MSSYVDVCRFVPTTGGTTDWTYSAAVQGYQSPSSAGIVNGGLYSYRAESFDLSQWEIGQGTYNTGTNVLTRTTVFYNSSGTGTGSGQTGAGTKINFGSAPQVAVVALAEDVRPSFAPQGRLTLATGTPVMSSSQPSKTTIFYTPYVGNQIPLYDGSNFYAVVCNEISVATTDTTKNPAAIGISKVNDWFVWNDSGTLRLTHSVDWTNDTTRASGLTLTNGIWLNTSSIANGPAALRGTYVGTTRSDGSSQLNWTPNPTAGSSPILGVWNTYNRVIVSSLFTVNAVYSYSSATIRAANGGTTTSRTSFISGLAEDSISVMLLVNVNLAAANAASFSVGFQLNNTTNFDSVWTNPSNNAATTLGIVGAAFGGYAPQLGYNFISANEGADGTNSSTAVWTAGRGGLSCFFRM